MRICFVSRRFFPTISGMSVYALNLLRELMRAGHDVTLVSQYRADELGTRVYGGGAPPPVEGVRVIGLESKGEQANGDFERDIKEMRDTIIREHAHAPFDIIHAQYAYPTGLAALEASRATNVPNLISIQGGDGHWVGLCCRTHKRAMLCVLGHAGALLIGSRSFAEEVHSNHGTDLERFTIVPGAVDMNRFRPREGDETGSSDLTFRPSPTLLYHGRVDRRKGALDLIDAFALVINQNTLDVAAGTTLPPSFVIPKLIISGIGPDTDAVDARINELRLKDHVEMLGYVHYESTPQVYKSADIFVSPTYAEGFSNTILEAMASGLPVISTRAVGVVDCLRNDGREDDNALLVAPGDVRALAQAIVRMLTDENLRHKLVRQSLSEVERIYSWRAVADQIIGIYEMLRGTHPDKDWTLDDTITPCRFRKEPHLL